MVKLARGGMNHPRGEIHLPRGRGFFPRFPVHPPPGMGHPYFPRPFRSPPPPSARGRTLPGSVVPPQFSQNPVPSIPPPCGPFVPRGTLPISPSGRPYHPRPIISHQSALPPQNGSFTPFLRKPVLAKGAGGKVKQKPKRKSKPKERSEGLFFCEACDRGWNTEESLNNHKAEHRTCGVEGCTLSAHPKVIEKHIQQQHMTGLYKRITASYDPEDITRWLAERKSRYPTKENIEKKKAQREEMFARGERMPQNTHRQRGQDRRQDFNRERGRRKRRYQNRRQRSKDMTKKETDGKENSQVEDGLLGCNGLKEDISWEDNWRGDLPKFPGTAAFPEIKIEVNDTVQEEFSDEEWENSKSKASSKQPPLIMSQALMTLSGTYASESEDDDVQPPNKKHKHSNTVKKKEIYSTDIENSSNTSETAHIGKSDTIIEKEIDFDDSSPEEAPIIHKVNVEDKLENDAGEIVKTHEEEQSLHSKKHVNSEKCTHRFNSKAGKDSYNTRSVQRRRRLTLLERLLRKEICHERNVILQCVRYVVQNNFLK